MAERLGKKLEVELARTDKVPDALSEPHNEPSSLDRILQTNFVEWCVANGVRHCPAKPGTVAYYIFENRTSTPHDQLLESLGVIARMHDRFNLSNPVASALVRATLELTMVDKPPRSWSKEEQKIWVTLNPEARGVMHRLEHARAKGIGRFESELAKLRKKYETKPETEISAAKSNGNSGEPNTVAAS